MNAHQSSQSQLIATQTGENTVTQMIPTQTTQNRRHYPREPKGVKNEWHALIKHQAEVNNQIAQFEKDLKYLRSQELSQAYDQKVQEQIRSKELQLQLKQSEEQQMKSQLAQYEQELARQKQEKQAIQSYLADSYDTLIQQHAHLKNEERQLKLELENRHLEENRRKLESEQRRKLRAKKEFSEIAQDQISEFFNKKGLEKLGQTRFKNEYRQQIQKNIQRDALKEDNYKQFYQATADHQKQLEELHVQNVLSDYQQRQQKIIQTIEKRIADAEKQAFEKDMQQRLKKEDIKHGLKSILQNQMEFKSEVKESEKKRRMREVEESLRMSQEYQQSLQDFRVQKQLLQQQYKDILDKQQQEREEKLKMNRMTKHEKKLNSMDLQAYKNSDHKLHSLINGFQHSRYDFSGSPALKKIVNSSLIGTNNFNSTDISSHTPQMKYRHHSSVDYGSSGTDAFNNLREQRKVTITSLPVSASHTPNNKLKYQGSTGSFFVSPTYKTSANSILSNQISQKYANHSPSNTLSGEKTRPDPINEDVNYRPSRHIPFSKLINQQLLNPEQGKSMPNLHKSVSPLTIETTLNHNPVTNPLPFNCQNPYVLKQLYNGRSSSEKRGSLSNYTNGNIFALQAQN